MVRTRLTAAEPYTAGRLEVVVDLEPHVTVAALEQALTGLPHSAQTTLWLGATELPREATVAAAGIRDGVVLSVGGPSRDPQPTRTTWELQCVSGPTAGTVHPLTDGVVVIGGPSSDIALDGLEGQHLSLLNGPAGVVATSLDPDHPVQRAGVPLMTAIALSAGDQLALGAHLVAVAAVDEGAPAPVLAGSNVEVQGRRRARNELGSRTLEPPTPPTAAPAPGFAVVPALMPLVVGLLLGWLVSSWLFVLVLAAPLVAFGMRWYSQQRAVDEFDQAVADYDQAVVAFAADTARLMRDEIATLRDASPDPVTLHRSVAAVDERVWERARTDDDRLLLRVGTASTTARSWRVGEQPAQLLHDVPVTVSLRRAGVVGIAAPLPQARSLARWLVVQAAALHSPEDLSIWLLSDPGLDGAADWDWLRWLPHNRGLPELSANRIGNSDDTISARIEELTALVAERRALALPAAEVLVVLEGDLTGRPGLPELLRDGPSHGVFTLCLGSPAVPKQSRCVLTLTPDDRLTVSGTGALPEREVRADLVKPAWAEQLGRALAPLRSSARELLPFSCSLVQLVGDAPIDERWQTHPSAPIGVLTDRLLSLDLTQSPHVLIAGDDEQQTADLLQTTVTSLALCSSPERLSLVLLGEHGELNELPHVSNVLGNLDGAQAARVLASLTAELHRREALLASGVPLPALVVVVDDVTALAERLPDFVDRLASLLEGSGRLAIHLLMATSRLSAVPEKVLRVATTRLVLRVSDAAVSQKVLGNAAAAGLLERVPGRGYARFGNAPLQPFQAATRTVVETERGPLHALELPWERLGLPLLVPGPGRSALPDLIATMRKVGIEAQPSPWLPPLADRVLLDEIPLPDGDGTLAPLRLGMEDLPGEQAQRPAVWDLAHDGNLLAVGAARSGRSTLLLTLAASLTTAATSSVVHLYALDCGNGALRPLSGLPHCGAVVAGDDPDRADRLLTRLAAEVARRRKQLAERGFADLAAQRKGTADPLPYLVLLIDGWEGFASSLGRVGGGRLVETLVELLRDGGPAGLRIAITGDRSVLTSDLAPILQERLVLRLDGDEDYALAGLEPHSVPERVPSGRAFRARAGEMRPAVTSVQIASVTGDLASLAADLPPARGRKPFRIDVLPASVTWAEAQQLTPSGPGAALAVGGDELRLQTVNLLTCGPGFTVAGPPGSGRSTALLVLARSLLEAGTQICLVTPAPSPLAELRGAPGVLSAGDLPSRLAAVLERAIGPVVVLVDDADQVADEELSELLHQVLRQARPRDHAVVLAGGTEQLAATRGGFAFDARRSRSGLLLSPASPDEGDLLGVRLDRSAVFSGPPGRGLLIRSGNVLLAQVPAPE